MTGCMTPGGVIGEECADTALDLFFEVGAKLALEDRALLQALMVRFDQFLAERDRDKST